ncbi:T9SS type A sorting domain-containing protein [Hymenobacter sp. BRD128]|uniref:T9SS type A sorting domain-containing protein n=1 Tax=Hymenobacter sp. BRD128 TaxID=2675878 RepID=UPI0015653DB7|nr:T9SS type A sorting domain-containing protein [Hymenobacter sp. BRD128]QKG58225.1 T9SS type A sorting domain-containing protein [Hymenobacter sp. BRD128]
MARVGDGSATLTAAAAPVFLDEYTPGGTLVQTINLPTAVSSSNRILTAAGSATAELGLTRSADGHYLVLAGYGAAPGTPAVASSAATDVTRVIGLIGADGSIDTSTSTGSAFDGASIRAAATADGTSFYSVGSDGGVQYQALGSYAATQLNTAPLSVRSLNVAGGNLYVSTNLSPYVGLSQVGAGLPTAAGQTVTALPGFPGTTAGASPYGFYLADLSATVPGVDVAYVADDRIIGGGGVQKWSLVAGSWVLNGTIAGTVSTAVRGLSGSTSGTAVSLAASSSAGLFFITDNAGYNMAPSLTSLPSAVATAGPNTAFRGVAFAPVAAAPTIASFTPTMGGIGTAVTITGTNLTGATAVRIGTLDIPTFTVASATTITLVVPTTTSSISGPLTVVTPGGTATSSTNFNLVLATLASQALPELSIFPNPATDYVQIELPQASSLTVSLRDLVGRQVLAPVVLAAHQPLRLPASLAAGVYLLEIEQGATKAVRRIEKK